MHVKLSLMLFFRQDFEKEIRKQVDDAIAQAKVVTVNKHLIGLCHLLFLSILP